MIGNISPFSFPQLSFISLTIFFIPSGNTLPLSPSQSLPQPEGYIPLTSAFNCFPKLIEPQCSFWVSKNASTLKEECLNIATITKIPALRIQGEFDTLLIRCSASYPIDFLYYGVQPTEAMFIEWFKEISPHSSLSIQNYTVEVKVHSVQSLFNYHSDPANSFYEDSSEDRLPLKVKHDYSRSGNLSFPGIFNKSLGTSFYFFLEDSAKPSFLQNGHTSSVSLILGDPPRVQVPCVSSHYATNFIVEGVGPEGPLDPKMFNPIDGFVITPKLILFGNYSCTLKSGENVLDTVKFFFQQDPVPLEINFGLENFNQASGEGIEITGDTPATPNGFVKFIHPICKTKDPYVQVDPEKAYLISVPSPNFGHMRLVQQFALPQFVNRSYTARLVEGDWDPLTREIRQRVGVNQRMGTVYCYTGHGEKIVDFGSAIVVGKIIPFNFGLDWAKFDRRNSNIKVHFGIKPLNHKGTLYIDSEVQFECRVNVPVLVKPVVWYSEMNNGTFVQEHIDYNLNYDISIQTIKISPDLKAVSCASSYWYSDFWRNISYKVNPKLATAPVINELEREYKLELDSVNQNIPCSATGDPIPEIYFEKDGKRAEGIVQNANSTILIIRKVDKSQEGTYSCVAKNVYITRQDFKIVVEEEDGGNQTQLVLTITIPLLVFVLTALTAVIYIKCFRVEKSGLTKQEIEDFMKGLSQKDAQVAPSDGNDYTHEFAVMRPYVKEYEVPPNRFKIDESKVLGKGAFGLVLQGTVDDNLVAVKTVQRNADKQYLKALLSELKIMIHLGQHDNVVQIVGACTKDLRRGFVYVFVKYLPMGNLQSYLRNKKQDFDPNWTPAKKYDNPNSSKSNAFGLTDMINWSRQIATGMEYLGSKHVIHGDLAARNVLLDDNKVAKVTDFGLSRQLYDYNDYIKKHQEPLPWRWMALESLKYMAFSKQSDIWSFGVVMWEVFSLAEVPYPGYSWNLDFVEDLENGLRMSRPKHGSVDLFTIMCECWHPEPGSRPAFSSIRTRLSEIRQPEVEQDPLQNTKLVSRGDDNIAGNTQYSNSPTESQEYANVCSSAETSQA